MYIKIFKPFIDRMIGLLGLLCLSPLLLILIVVLGIHFKGSPFFVQRRVGKANKLFSIVKFRTMNNKKDANGKLIPDRARLTRLGRFVRKSSLDELPQLFNLLVGDMSLIGPRPLLVEYLSLYNKEQAKRHWVKPGITGLAQVNGRNGISWEKKFHYDLIYVRQQSLKLDVQIFLKSFESIIFSKNVFGEGGEVEPFKGSKR